MPYPTWQKRYSSEIFVFGQHKQLMKNAQTHAHLPRHPNGGVRRRAQGLLCRFALSLADHHTRAVCRGEEGRLRSGGNSVCHPTVQGSSNSLIFPLIIRRLAGFLDHHRDCMGGLIFPLIIGETPDF